MEPVHPQPLLQKHAHSFWKQPRDNGNWVKQWQRRQARAQQTCPFILQEVERRMHLRASIMRLVNGPILHQGWAVYAQAELLAAQYPEKPIHWATPTPQGLSNQHTNALKTPTEWFKVPKLIKSLFNTCGIKLQQSFPKFNRASQCAQAIRQFQAGPQEALAVADGEFSMVWSPLWLHHINDPKAQLQAWYRVLKPQGVLFFSCFGPDTAQELQEMVRQVDGDNAVLPDFADMHDWGDLLVQHGFSDPVMEMEKITLVYQSPKQLLAECHALVGNNARRLNALGCVSPKGLAPAKRWQAFIEALANTSAKHKLTLEIIYGHAWKIERLSPGVAVVNVDGITRKNNKKHAEH